MFFALISPNFNVKSIIFFPILARDFFPKVLEKGLLTFTQRHYTDRQELECSDAYALICTFIIFLWHISFFHYL